jgi:AcrR family transcriptional regulator
MSHPDRVAAQEALAAAPGFPAIAASLDPALPETVRCLILAGLQCFAERGYNATTTRDVALRAGLSPAGMYVHFPSKAELLARVVSIANEGTLHALTASLFGVDAPADRLRAVISTLAALLAENHAAGRVANYEYRHLPDELRAPIDEQRVAIRRVVYDVIKAGLDAGTFDVPDANVAARALISLCVDVSRWYSEEEAGDPRQLGATYADLALRLVG